MNTLTEMMETSEEFMTGLISALDEALVNGANFIVSASTIHRESDTGESTSVLDYSLDGAENVSVRLELDRNKVTNLIDYIVEKLQPIARMPLFGVDQIKYIIDNVYSSELDDGEMKDEIHSSVFAHAEFRGLASHLRFILGDDNRLTLEYSVTAEIHADTNDAEKAFLAEKGIADYFRPSDPTKFVPLFTQSVISLQPLM